MKITFNVTQKDIDKASGYYDNNDCLGCTVLKRVLGVSEIYMGGDDCHIIGSSNHNDISLGFQFSEYLCKTNHLGKVKPETHSIDIPDEILEQIGYFDQKGTTTADDYITKEKNIEDKINHDGHKVVEACQD